MTPGLVAADVLWQISATMQFVGKHYFHRDVNPRNILAAPVKDQNAATFWLIDFGTVVPAPQWRQNVGPGSWSEANPAGDTRYWPHSAWMRFLFGPGSLKQPGGFNNGQPNPWLDQYSYQLDRYA